MLRRCCNKQRGCGGHEEQACHVSLQQSKVENDRGNKEAALQLMLGVQSRYLKCNPNSKCRAFFLCEDIGWVYLHRKKREEARRWRDKAVAITKRLAVRSCQANFQHALCYASSAAVRLRLGIADDALRCLSTAEDCLKSYDCKGTNRVQEALYYLVVCFHLQGQTSAAWSKFKEALKAQVKAVQPPLCLKLL